MTARDMVVNLKEGQADEEYLGHSLLSLAVRRLRRDRLTLGALAVIVLITLSAIFAPQISRALNVSFDRTSGTNAFILIGGQDRLTFDPDYRFRARTLATAVVHDMGKDIKSKIVDTNYRDIRSEENGGLRVFHAGMSTNAFDIYVKGGSETGERALARNIPFGQAGDLIELPPGTYDVSLRFSTGDRAAEPFLSLNGVVVKAGWLAMGVVAGGEKSGKPLEMKFYPQNLAAIDPANARLQFIQASADAPLLNVTFGGEVIAENVVYEQEVVYEAPRQTSTLGTSAMDAPRRVLGTDDLGRDQFARLLFGGQVSLGIAFSAALIAATIGITIGILTGFYGGLLDDGVNWVITTISSLPTLLLLLIIIAVTKPGPPVLIAVLGLLGWFGVARLVRGETFSIRAREYVVSARSIGAPVSRIMLVHILPNLLSVVMIALALNIGGLILTESALSYLGFGINPPTPSWGNMLSNSQTFFTKGVHLLVVPGLLITITVLCLYVIGDGLRDAFDPTLKN